MKKINKKSLFIILDLIIIGIMAIIIYKFYNEKIEANQKSAELQIQVNNLNRNVSYLQGK